ncbi:hypothetical protein OsccyDRAFT_0497 [Leptolyngbyaceae cyanobacterium JSC-12]|nr:hypothetical protein OsccyDRAFT_0497 [Leptolyngbyaceae cyanobacterium JSC-12]
MDTQAQARALMIRHQHLIKNREQCLLSRAANDVGMPAEAVARSIDHGKTHPYRPAYDRSNVGLS